MRKLIRNSFTRQYLAAGGRWTPNAGEAKPVGDSLQAIAIVKLLGIDHAELCYFSDVPGFPNRELVIPVNELAASLSLQLVFRCPTQAGALAQSTCTVA